MSKYTATMRVMTPSSLPIMNEAYSPMESNSQIIPHIFLKNLIYLYFFIPDNLLLKQPLYG